MTTAATNSYPKIIQASLAIVIGLGIGYLDLYTTEVTVTIVALLLAGFVLGLLQPKAAWRWAVLLTLGLPIMEIVGQQLSLHTAELIHLDPRVTLVALVFALIGSYVGVVVRWLVATFTSSGESVR
jgi:hypothetical protein